MDIIDKRLEAVANKAVNLVSFSYNPTKKMIPILEGITASMPINIFKL